MIQSTTQISIAWTAPGNGGDAITDYKVYWDQGTGIFVNIANSTSGQTSFYKQLATNGSDAGKSFNFLCTAVNSIGESVYSDAYLVVAATIPDAPTMLVRNNITTKTMLSLSWS